MSWKDDFVAKHGEGAYANRLERRRKWAKQKYPEGEKQRSRERRKANPEEARGYERAWRERNPEKIKEKGRQICRKGGKYYEKKKVYKQTGLSGERERTRMRDGHKWRAYKNIIAPDSQLHHQWIPGTAEYIGLALVEKNQHMHGIIDVIKILDGNITLYTEKEIREQEIKM